MRAGGDGDFWGQGLHSMKAAVREWRVASPLIRTVSAGLAPGRPGEGAWAYTIFAEVTAKRAKGFAKDAEKI